LPRQAGLLRAGADGDEAREGSGGGAEEAAALREALAALGRALAAAEARAGGREDGGGARRTPAAVTTRPVPEAPAAVTGHMTGNVTGHVTGPVPEASGVGPRAPDAAPRARAWCGDGVERRGRFAARGAEGTGAGGGGERGEGGGSPPADWGAALLARAVGSTVARCEARVRSAGLAAALAAAAPRAGGGGPALAADA
jgi:hypothetical protein